MAEGCIKLIDYNEVQKNYSAKITQLDEVANTNEALKKEWGTLRSKICTKRNEDEGIIDPTVTKLFKGPDNLSEYLTEKMKSNPNSQPLELVTEFDTLYTKYFPKPTETGGPTVVPTVSNDTDKGGVPNRIKIEELTSEQILGLDTNELVRRLTQTVFPKKGGGK